MPFFNRAAFVAGVLSLTTLIHISAFAQDDLQQLKKISEERKRDVVASGILDSLRPPKASENRYTEDAKKLSSQSLLDMTDSMVENGLATREQADAFVNKGDKADSTSPGDRKRQLYVSFSIPDKTLRNLFKSASKQNAVVFFNGLEPGMKSIDDMMRRVAPLLKGIDNPPQVRFNPYKFHEYEVTTAPTIVYQKDDISAIASGITDFDWLIGQHERLDETKNFGKYGPVSPVIEKNLIEEIEERYNALDMGKRKREAVANFWKNQKYTVLPTATEDSTHFINPTARITKDIKNARGDVLAMAGEVINPLKNRSVGSTYIIFNPLVPEQLQWLRTYLMKNKTQGRTMLITSEMKHKGGWSFRRKLVSEFEQEIFVMQEEMVNRFKVTAVPAVVTTDLERLVLKVQQFGIEE